MNKIKKIARSTERFVEAHKTAIAVSLTAIVLIKLNRSAINEHNEFLKEHDLYEKFYDPERF